MSDGVVYKGINRLLENSFLVAQNDIRGIYLFKLLETIIAINNASIKVIDIRRGIASAVKRHHGTNSRWNDRNTYQKHPFRSIAGIDHPSDSTDTFIQARNFRRRSMLKFCLNFF